MIHISRERRQLKGCARSCRSGTAGVVGGRREPGFRLVESGFYLPARCGLQGKGVAWGLGIAGFPYSAVRIPWDDHHVRAVAFSQQGDVPVVLCNHE